MTDDTIALCERLEKGSDTSFLREMIGFARYYVAAATSEKWVVLFRPIRQEGTDSTTSPG